MMSMGFPPFSLTGAEVEKTERLDAEVFRILVAAGITEKFMWTSPSSASERLINLRIAGQEHTPIAQFSEAEFDGLSDQAILARVHAGAQQARG